MTEMKSGRFKPGGPMIKALVVMATTVVGAALATGLVQADQPAYKEPSLGSRQPLPSYTGSTSCRKCHEKFYQLWAPSHHGLAMQPYSAELARIKLLAQAQDITIGNLQYRAEIGSDQGWVTERGPHGEKKYPIDHVMGGKNVYYFLTSLDRGRLQTLPLAYDVRKREWFDMAASGVRHFPGQTDEPIDWKDWQYTFNTACYGCHVSQLSTNYDPKTDTYNTVWKEPGINCETCHGPAEEHIRVCESAPKGTVPEDMKITRGGRSFTKDQNNATCSSCHAKAVVLTNTFQPGDRFFDHFGLVTLENPDYYPDGRDLGENYTYTSWLMSPCVKSGKLDCLHCHTSSGRYKFKAEEKANDACMPCHEDKTGDPTKHTRHKAKSAGNKCIACHMPLTEFARMHRSDHSMLPPTPAATIAFKSPNACNDCHKDETPQWADQMVRKWRTRDYQQKVLHRSGLLDAARTNDWNKLPEMLEYVTSKDRDDIFTASLIRLLPGSRDPRVHAILHKTIKDPSPLVRAATAEALQHFPGIEAAKALVEACGDDFRLVRVRAAASIASFKDLQLTGDEKQTVEAANSEYLVSMTSRPDQWDAHYSLGNYYLEKDDFKQALACYDAAMEKEPRAVLAMVNKAMVYARMGANEKADEELRKALHISPDNAVANFNMGLLKAEENDLKSSETHLKAALKADPRMAQAAYNLCVILSKDRMDEAMEFCGKAAELRPDQPRYAYTLAFFQQQRGDLAAAANVLDELLSRYPGYGDAYVILGRIYEKQGKEDDAAALYNKGLAAEGVPIPQKAALKARLEAIKARSMDGGAR